MHSTKYNLMIFNIGVYAEILKVKLINLNFDKITKKVNLNTIEINFIKPKPVEFFNNLCQVRFDF